MCTITYVNFSDHFRLRLNDGKLPFLVYVFGRPPVP